MLKKIINTVKHMRAMHEDAKLNRKLIGMDRLGNKYYQHFDGEGYETKRECQYMSTFNEKMIDPFWDDWLHKRRLQPFSEEELKKLYKEFDERQQLNKSNNENSQKSQKFYKPGSWKP